MLHRRGFTLMEMIVVVLILGVTLAFCFPNFTAPTEQARASNARNNLLAIYSAEQNYNNNNGAYCINTSLPNACDASIIDINTALGLSIQDDGTYAYICNNPSAGVYTCTATRNGTPSTNIVLTLNTPVQLNGNVNPVCSTANNWCPN